MQPQSGNCQRTRTEFLSQPSKQISGGLWRYLVLDCHMRPPARRILEAQQPMEIFRKIVSNSLKLWRYDAECNSAAKVHEPLDEGAWHGFL